MTLVKTNGRVPNFSLPSVLNEFFTRDNLNWGKEFSSTGTNIPAVNIRETADNFQVEMAAPGMDKKDFRIELDGHTLTISTEKNGHREQNADENYMLREFSYKSFYRTFHLAKEVVDADQIKARYENGLLMLTIPKREDAKQRPPRSIEIV